FCRPTVLAADDLFFALGIARHRIGLNRKKGSEVVGKLGVEEKGLVNPVLVDVWRKFVESIGVAHDGNEIEALPCPVEAGRPFPFIPTLIRGAWVRSSAGQVAIIWPELSEDEPLEDEFIQVGYLSGRSEGPPWRWPLVLEAEIKAPSLLSTQVLICEQNTGDESASIALDSARSGAIQHLLSQRSSHNSAPLDLPERTREGQTGHRVRRIAKAPTERT